MALGTPTWVLDDPVAGTFTFNSEELDDAGVQWIAEDVDGFWGSPQSNAELTGKVARPGSFRTPGYKESAVVTLSLVAYSRRGDYAQDRRNLLNIASVGSDPDLPTRLTCYSEIGPVYMDLYLSGDILPKTRVAQQPASEWSIQMTATDPKKYSASQYVAQTGIPGAGGGGLDATDPGLDGSVGLDAGDPPTSGTLMLANAGTAPSTPLLELHGPLDTPTITAPSGVITYNGSIDAGRTVYIDPDVPSVFLDDANQRRLAIPFNYRAFEIPKNGSLTVGLSHTGSSSATGYLRVLWRDAYA